MEKLIIPNSTNKKVYTDKANNNNNNAGNLNIIENSILSSLVI